MPRAAVPYRRNFALVLVLESLWAFGTWLAHPMTLMPDFLLRLGGTATHVGLLAPLWGLGTGLGALAVGGVLGRRRAIAPRLGWLHLVATLPWLALAALASAAGAGRIPPRAALWAALGLLLTFNLLIGGLVQAYFVLLARVFPERGRGAWFGALFALSSAVALTAPWLAARGFISEAATLDDYRRVFLVAFGCFVAGSLPFFGLAEARDVPLPARSPAAALRALRALWAGRPALRGYLEARLVLELGLLCGSFTATYARVEGGFTEHQVTAFGLLVIAAHAAASWGLGALTARLEARRGDPRRVYLRVQWGAQALSFAALAFAAFGPARPAAVGLALAAGLRVSSDFVLHPNLLLELGSRAARLDAMALGAVVLMTATLAVATVAGRAIDAFGHRAVFAAAVALALLGLRRLWRLGAAPARRRTAD